MKKLIALIFMASAAAFAQCPAAMSTLTASTNLATSVDSKVCGLSGAGTPTASWCTTALIGKAKYVNTSNGDEYSCTANLTWTLISGAVGPTGPSGLLSGTLAAIPVTCTVGASMYQATDQMVTEQLYACTSTNTWTRQAYTQGLSGSLPGTCTVGQIYFAIDATAGQNLYFCTASNTWTQQLNSGGGGSGVTSVQISGTSRKIQVSGTCTITTTGVCTLTLPSDLLLPLNTAFNASTTAGPATNIPSGVAPTAPVSGDFWNLGGALQYHNGSTTKTLAVTSSLAGFVNSDDYSTFTLACSAAVTASSTLVISKAWSALTTQSCAAPIAFNQGGILTPASGQVITLTGGFKPVPFQVFSGASGGTFKIGPNSPVVYSEMWGALGNGSNDDSGAINAALTAVAPTSTIGPGEVHLLSKNYNIGTGTITVPSYVTFSGSGMRGVDLSAGSTKANTLITSTSATATIVSVAGSSTFCGVNATFFTTIKDLNVTRSTTASGSAKGISIVNGCWTVIKNVESFDSISNFYVNGSGGTLFERTQAYWTATSGLNRNGYDFDGNGYSLRVKHAVAACNGSNIKGMYVHGSGSADLFVDDYESAICDYGVYLDGGGSTLSDIHFSNIVLDQCAVSGVYLNNIQTGINGSVMINGAYIHATTSAVGKIGIDIAGASANIMISKMQLRNFGTGIRTGTSSGQIGVYSSVFNGCTTCISLLGNENIIQGNLFNSPVATPATTLISTGASTVANIISNNMFTGYATTAVSLNATSTLNVVYPNVCDSSHITTCISNSGSGNDFGSRGRATDGVAAPTLNVASCTGAALGTGSTNDAGTITGVPTGSCSVVLTFGTTIATNGWVCSANNRTTVANAFQQTASSTTTATLGGTTVTGDTLGYTCTWN